MITLHCHTNLDLRNEKWPTQLPQVPRVGDLIESAYEHSWKEDTSNCHGFPPEELRRLENPKARLELEVYRVTWKFIPQSYLAGCYAGQNEGSWQPYIELHFPKNRFGSIRQFYEWYAKICGTHVGAFI